MTQSVTFFEEISPSSVKLIKSFWTNRLEINRSQALLHQWEQMEQNGTIDNFRLLANRIKGFRRGFFYNDSDLHKWAEATSLTLLTSFDSFLQRDLLEVRLREYVDLMTQVQAPDGYIFTYNQFHFPNRRWANLQIEHELYCHGHFIEAGIAHLMLDPESQLFPLVIKSADLLVRTFLPGSSLKTPGHPEIELALLKLFSITKHTDYLRLAQTFLEKRGRDLLYGLHLLQQKSAFTKYQKLVEQQRIDRNLPADPAVGFNFTQPSKDKAPKWLQLRVYASYLTGKCLQQHTPIRKMKKPEGHAVRWGYLMAAAAKSINHSHDLSYLPTLEQSWKHMVERRMFVSGGVGSIPIVEGFGFDYELDSHYAYCETCAAIATFLWSWELLQITHNARYADLMEWQLYNAISVGMGQTGVTYLYQNPLAVDSPHSRQSWFKTSCCPSNISRVWGSLGKYCLNVESNSIWIHQYISFSYDLSGDLCPCSGQLLINSALPWEGETTIDLQLSSKATFTLYLRIPSWTQHPRVKINQQEISLPPLLYTSATTASGYSPYISYYAPLTYDWDLTNQITISFDLPIISHQSDPKVKSTRGMLAFSRGPVLYCLESVDNPEISIPNALIQRNSPLEAHVSTLFPDNSWILSGFDPSKRPLTFIPYFNWANRAPSTMQIWVHPHE